MTDIKTAEAYNKFAKYYDAYINDFKDDLALYCSFCSENDRILEVGCGTGRVLKCLLDKGLTDVTGVDTSEEMLKIAKKKLLKYLNSKLLTLRMHNFRQEPLKKNFNKVFVTYYTFNYILENPAKFLRNIYLSMGNNSLVCIDLFYPMLFLDPTLDNVWTERKLKLEGDRTVTLRSKKSFDGSLEQRILVFVENGNTTTIESTRRFYTKEEIEKLLYDSGFTNVKAIYGYSIGDTSKFAEDDYPLHGYNEFNVNLEEYANREETKPNFVVYAYKFL
jgi:ubiquinone/menaquinone biosynthesis C-methylase UbiE